MSELGKAPSTEGYRFGSRHYIVGQHYAWRELPATVQHDIVVQADDIEARYGRDPRTLKYQLIKVPHADLVRMLADRFGQSGYSKRIHDPKLVAFAHKIERAGLQYPPVLEEGLQRALALSYLGWDMPYFTLDEPIEMPEHSFIPTLDGAKKPVNINLELDMARNMFGKLEPETRERLQAVLDDPSDDTWSNAYSVIIGADRWMTLWQAVLAVDPTFPKIGPSTDQRGRRIEGWRRIPSQELLLTALKYATH